MSYNNVGLDNHVLGKLYEHKGTVYKVCKKDGEMCRVGGFYSAESLAQSDKEEKRCLDTSHSSVTFSDPRLQ